MLNLMDEAKGIFFLDKKITFLIDFFILAHLQIGEDGTYMVAEDLVSKLKGLKYLIAVNPWFYYCS